MSKSNDSHAAANEAQKEINKAYLAQLRAQQAAEKAAAEAKKK